MKQFLLVVFVFGACAASAQGLDVTVRNRDAQPMPYAYINVNGHTVSVSDSLGRGKISLENLALGDTLSASCLGATQNGVVYDSAMQERGACDLVLDDPMISAVEVYPDWVLFFTQHFQDIKTIYCSGTLTADFSATIYNSDFITYPVEGSLRAENKAQGVDGLFWNPGEPIQYTTSSDTVGLSGRLDTCMHDALINGNRGATRYLTTKVFRNLVRKTCHMTYAYSGTEEGIMKFRVLLTPRKLENPPTFQVLLYIDGETKELLRSEEESISFSIDGRVVKYSVEKEYTTYQYKKKAPMLVAKNIHHHVEIPGLYTADIDITNARFEH